MKKSRALIEKSESGYTIFSADIQSTIIGVGATEAEAKADFENSVMEVKQMFAEDGILNHELEGVEFVYDYYTPSVTDEFQYLNITRVAQLAEIPPSAMRQYVKGKIPPVGQAHKIEAALHTLGAKLQVIRL